MLMEIIQVEPFEINSKKGDWFGTDWLMWEDYGTTHGNPPRPSGKIHTIKCWNQPFNEEYENYIGQSKEVIEYRGKYKFK